jgi:hypothetical protein
MADKISGNTVFVFFEVCFAIERSRVLKVRIEPEE